MQVDIRAPSYAALTLDLHDTRSPDQQPINQLINDTEGSQTGASRCKRQQRKQGHVCDDSQYASKAYLTSSVMTPWGN